MTPLPERQLAPLQPFVAQNGVSGNDILLIWMLSNQQQSLQHWQPASMSAAAAAAPAAVACTSHTLAVVPQQAMQTAMAETGESSTAQAVLSDKAPSSKCVDYFHLWLHSINEQSLQQWQPDMPLSAAGAATTTARTLQDPTSVIATASTADGESTPIIFSLCTSSLLEGCACWFSCVTTLRLHAVTACHNFARRVRHALRPVFSRHTDTMGILGQ